MCEEEKRVKLTSVKKGIYNPHLPSLKEIEKDDALGKLSHQHVRTSLPAGIELPDELFYQYNPSSFYIPNYEVLPLYHMKWREEKVAEELSFLNNPHLSQSWRDFIRQLPLGEHRIVRIPQVKDFQFLNYHVRYQKPEVSSKWRSYIKKESVCTEERKTATDEDKVKPHGK